MTRIYCKASGHTASPRGNWGAALCTGCSAFLDYAHYRLERCPYGTAKPACSECPIHCYGKQEREQARTIMRFSGPRMLQKHPLLSILHFWDKWRASSRVRKWQQSRKKAE